MITTKYHVTVNYIPATEEHPRQYGTFLILWLDEVEEEVMSISDTIVMWAGTPASDPFITAEFDSISEAMQAEKYIEGVLVKYGYRVI